MYLEETDEYKLYEVESMTALNNENCIKIIRTQSQVYKTYYCVAFSGKLKFGLIGEGHGIPPHVERLSDHYIISLDDKLYVVNSQIGDITFKVLDSLIFDILFYADSIAIICELDVYSFCIKKNSLQLNWLTNIEDVVTGYKLTEKQLFIESKEAMAAIDLSNGYLNRLGK
ncbi:hypothetical protein [Listeria booriae]|uniref:Uncharacterized protein n=1 Tax=Listeria booriae TaxID=1552123 RepID=A0A841XQ67_9LIST|nr:hypothetical protein [Listeria booriae]MBC1247571.1 hypothetical protein [Listeria booriae]MBC1286196.1 hypothetical protein [Listeria booriae]MBC1317274.1 hypothetical protein [Listeria booriae]